MANHERGPSGEKIPKGTGSEMIAKATATMLSCIMAHVTCLAQRRKIARLVVARVMIEMRAGKDYVGAAEW